MVSRAARLKDVQYPPVASVTAAYRTEWFREDLPGGTPGRPLVGFGHLIPRKMKIRSLGSIWATSLFPGRAPEGWEIVTTFIGGARDWGVGSMSEEVLAYQADQDVKRLLLKDDAPQGMRLGCKVWRKAIPQYDIGHQAIIDGVEKDEFKVPGMFMGGNYRYGVAIGDCVDFGISESDKIAKFLKERKKEEEEEEKRLRQTACTL